MGNWTRNQPVQQNQDQYGIGAYGIGDYGVIDPTRYAWTRVKAVWGAFLLCFLLAGRAEADSTTVNLGLTLPQVGVVDATNCNATTQTGCYGTKLNNDLTTLDAAICDKRVGCSILGPLTVTGGITGNASTSTVSANLGAGLIGQIPVQTGANSTAFLPAIGNGGLIIGSGTSTIPSTGTLTGTSNQVAIANAAGSVTISLGGPHNFTTQTSHGAIIGEGTGTLSSVPAMGNGGLIIGDGTGVDPSTGTLTGTSNQVVVTNGAGTITLSLPQNIHSAASPTFSAMTLTSLSSNTVIMANSSSSTVSLPQLGAGGLIIGTSVGVAPSTGTLTGTSNEISVTNTSGVITLAATGQTTTCTANQALVAATYNGGVATGGTCTTLAGQSSRTRQVFTSGTSQTYTTPANAKQLLIRMVGGGGGGAASSSGTGGTGGTTIFNSINANGGTGGAGTSGAAGVGGNGGTGSASFRISGQNGQVGFGNESGAGGNSAFFGGGAWGIGGTISAVGNTAITNSGGGGSGAANGASTTGSGGGAGESVELIINSPSASYTYSVGAGGIAGTGTGNNGGVGAAGIIIVDEYY